MRELYDRVGKAVDGGLDEVIRAVRDGTASAIRAGQRLAAARRVTEPGERHLAAANRAARRASDTLARILRDSRRPQTARPTYLIRRPGPDRDKGPSR